MTPKTQYDNVDVILKDIEKSVFKDEFGEGSVPKDLVDKLVEEYNIRVENVKEENLNLYKELYG